MGNWDPVLWRRLSPLLDEALELERSGRAAFLHAVRADDPDLAAALERMLAAHEQVLASTFLESSPVPGETTPSLAGHRVGSYTLERPLGVGGMGTVWLARRSDGRFEGHAAVKFVNLAVLDHAGQERFRREGTLLARLSHPHIARLLDAGVTDAGQPFLVLEYVEGTQIDRYAAEHRLDVAGRLELFLQVADAVAHAHANLIVHRDLKPSNVLVDTSGRVKLLDFGVAALMAAESAGQPTTLTMASGPALTPEYAAPEQAAGEAVTTATDVYALGVLLFRLLAGRHPTAPRDGAPHGAVLRALDEQEPRRPSDVAASLRDGDADAARLLQERSTTRDRLRRALRGDLDLILAKALKKDPAERYRAVTVFADDVRRHLRHEPITARPDSMWYRTRTLVSRHRLEIGAAALIALALVVGTAVAVMQARASARDRDRALQRLRRAEATNDFSSFLLSQATPRGRPISNLALLADGEALIAKRFAADPALHVHLLLTLAERYQENQQFDDWRRVLQRAYDASQTLADPGLRAFAACSWALQFAEQGDAEKALALIAEAASVFESLPDDAEYESGCRVRESIAARLNRDGRRAVAAAERAVALEEARTGAPGREIEPLATLANAYSAAFDYGRADAAYRRLVAILDEQGLMATRFGAVTLNNWSVMLQDSGRLIAAAEISRRAVETARAADSENGASQTMLTAYGNALAATGEHAAAAAALDEALVKARVAGPTPRLVTALALAILAACEAGDPDRGARLLAEAERVRLEDRTPYAQGLIEASAARVALVRGDAAQAVTHAQRAVTTLEKATPSGASLLPAITLLARTLNAAGRPREALAQATRSLAMARDRQAVQEHSSARGQALLEAAAANNALGNDAAAREAVNGALEQLLPSVGSKARATQRAMVLRDELEGRVTRR